MTSCVFRNEIYCIPDFKYSSINWEAGRLTTCSKGFRSSGSTKRDKTEAALVVLLATWTWFIWCLFCMFNMWNRIEIDTSATCICLKKNSAWSCFLGMLVFVLVYCCSVFDGCTVYVLFWIFCMPVQVGRKHLCPTVFGIFGWWIANHTSKASTFVNMLLDGTVDGWNPKQPPTMYKTCKYWDRQLYQPQVVRNFFHQLYVHLFRVSIYWFEYVSHCFILIHIIHMYIYRCNMCIYNIFIIIYILYLQMHTYVVYIYIYIYVHTNMYVHIKFCTLHTVPVHWAVFARALRYKSTNVGQYHLHHLRFGTLGPG